MCRDIYSDIIPHVKIQSRGVHSDYINQYGKDWNRDKFDKISGYNSFVNATRNIANNIDKFPSICKASFMYEVPKGKHRYRFCPQIESPIKIFCCVGRPGGLYSNEQPYQCCTREETLIDLRANASIRLARFFLFIALFVVVPVIIFVLHRFYIKNLYDGIKGDVYIDMSKFPRPSSVSLQKQQFDSLMKSADFEKSMGFKTESQLKLDKKERERSEQIERERKNRNIPKENFITTNIHGKKMEEVTPYSIPKKVKQQSEYDDDDKKLLGNLKEKWNEDRIKEKKSIEKLEKLRDNIVAMKNIENIEKKTYKKLKNEIADVDTKIKLQNPPSAIMGSKNI